MAENEYKRLRIGAGLPSLAATDKMASHCEAPGCDRKARSRWQRGITLCAMHYLRMLNHGQLEIPGRIPPPADGICVAEGCLRAPRSQSAQMCEMHYYRHRRNGHLKTLVDSARYTHCHHCGAETQGNKHCSERCATRTSRGTPAMLQCLWCARQFQPLERWLCCSKECKAKHRRRQGKDFYSGNAGDPVFMAKIRANGHKRRARKLAAYVEHVDHLTVMERDKWVCHLCREKIPKGAKWPSGLFGSLDHVVPLAVGGLHSYANIKAAHLSCNCRKGAKTIGQFGLAFA